MINTIEDLLDNIKNGCIETDDAKVEALHHKKILLYGAGNIGKRLSKNLQDNKVEILGFIDKNTSLPKVIQEIPLYHPEDGVLDKWKDESYVILSALFSLNVYKEIKLYLEGLGFKNVFGLHEVNLSQVNCTAFYEQLFDSKAEKIEFLGKDKQKIIDAYYLLEEEQDRKLYLDYVRAHVTMDFTRFSSPEPMDLQYLAHDIDYIKDYNCFIDCGAYDGDTIRNLTQKGVKFKKIAAFEPQNDLFNKLTGCFKDLSSIETAIAIPCGVHEHTQVLKFHKTNDAPSASKIDENGDDMIQCVAIDEVLHGFAPTFIKMDIEGAEVMALKGAQETIKKYTPQLAICVYHSLSDVWEIPLLIHQLNPNYKFYLRNYNYMGLETVLYAFPK